MKKILAGIVIVFITFLFLIFLMLLTQPCCIDKARDKATKADLVMLRNAVVTFKMDTGRYPSAEKGLRELVEHPTDVDGWAVGGYLEMSDVPKDGWNNDFIYCVSSDNRIPFVIISLGADGKPGGTDDNADIYSTDLEGPLINKDREIVTTGCCP